MNTVRGDTWFVFHRTVQYIGWTLQIVGFACAIFIVSSTVGTLHNSHKNRFGNIRYWNIATFKCLFSTSFARQKCSRRNEIFQT